MDLVAVRALLADEVDLERVRVLVKLEDAILRDDELLRLEAVYELHELTRAVA